MDIDGTLLTSKGTMTQSTYSTLLDCANRGILVCIATARSGRIVFKTNEVPGDTGFLLKRGIYYNGATVFDQECDFYQHTPLPGDIVDLIVSTVGEADQNLQIALQHDNEYHSFKYAMSPAELDPWGFHSEELLPFNSARKRPTTKIMIYRGTNYHKIKKELVELHNTLIKAHGHSASIILADSRRSIYIISSHASKGAAVSCLANLNGVDARDIAVFGDDTPDLSMFGRFGYSVAMGNAIDPIKSNASFVTLSNDQDGVVHAIRNYLSL